MQWPTFKVPEGEAGDKALREAQAGLRDGLSVGALAGPDGYYFDTHDDIHYTSMELVETSLVAVPAFSDAQVHSVAAALAAYKEERERMTAEWQPAR